MVSQMVVCLLNPSLCVVLLGVVGLGIPYSTLLPPSVAMEPALPRGPLKALPGVSYLILSYHHCRYISFLQKQRSAAKGKMTAKAGMRCARGVSFRW